MDDLLSEKEQIEKLRTWWSENGLFVIGGVVLMAAAYLGVSYYQNAQREAAYQASGLYDNLTNLVVDGDVDDAEAIASQLSSEFGDTNYAAQARLAMARMYMDQNRDEDAADELRALLSMNIDEPFKHVARIRLAKVLLYQDKAQEVVDLVEGRDDSGFAERYAEVLGDAYVALNRPEDARSAYQRALFETGSGATVDQNFVQLKLLDLPVEPLPELAGSTAADEVAGGANETEDAAESAATTDEAGAASDETDEATE